MKHVYQKHCDRKWCTFVDEDVLYISISSIRLLERNLVGGKEGRGDRRTRESERDVGVGGDGGCSVVDPLSPSGSSHPITHEIFSGARGESGALLSTDLFTEPVVVSSVFS